MLAVQWAKICGAGDVFAFDTDEDKLAVATKTGVTATFCVKYENYLSRFLEITCDKGVDVVFESSGNAAGIGSSLLLAAKGGVVVLMGMIRIDNVDGECCIAPCRIR